MLKFNGGKNGVLNALNEKGFIVCSTMGWSMNPFLHQLTENVVIEKPQGKLEKYDVGLYIRKVDGALILHRVSKVVPKGYYFVGDNHIRWEKVEFDQVVGKMKGYYKGEKYVDVNSFSFKLKSRLWCFLPFKLIGVFFVRLTNKIKRIIKK